jgi:hypothetical protein
MNRKAYILVLAVFVLGAVVGGLGGYMWAQRVLADSVAHPAKRTHLERLTLELSLTPAQQVEVRAILNDTKAQFDTTYDTIPRRWMPSVSRAAAPSAGY